VLTMPQVLVPVAAHGDTPFLAANL